MKYRITKYNPKHRNSDGVYLLDEWTSYSDVGQIFNGKVFEIQEYLKVEEKYIEAIKALFNFFKINRFVIEGIEKNNEENDFNETDKAFLFPTYQKIQEDEIVSATELENTVKLILREYMWGKIILEDVGVGVSFGYDYYMYFEFNESIDISSLVSEIEKGNILYVD